MKENKSLIIIIIILSILILGMTSYIIYDKVLTNDTKNISDSKDKEIDKEDNTDVINYDLKEINEELQEIEFIIPLRNLIDFNNNDIKYNTNYIENKQNKVNFIWNKLIQDEDIKKDDLFNAYIEKNDFINEYKKLFNEDISIDEILENDSLKIENDYIKGNIDSGYGLDEFILKAKEIEQVDTNNYILKIDFLSKKTNNEIEYDAISQYKNPNILEYPNDIVYAKMNINYTKYDNNFYIKSIEFEK